MSIKWLKSLMLLKLFKFNSTLFASLDGFMNNSWLLLQYYYFITLICIVGVPIWFNKNEAIPWFILDCGGPVDCDIRWRGGRYARSVCDLSQSHINSKPVTHIHTQPDTRRTIYIKTLHCFQHFPLTPYTLSICHISCLSIISYAFSKSMNPQK